MTTGPDPLPRIALVTHSAAPSGAELFVLRVARAAHRMHPVVIVGEDGPLVAMLRAHDIETVVVPLATSVRNRTARSGLRSAMRAATGTTRAVRSLAKTLTGLRIDVVTTHSAKAHVYAAVAARLAGIAVVAHVHDVATGEHLSRMNGSVLRTALNVAPHHHVANSALTRSSLTGRARRAAVVGCPADIGVVRHAPDDTPLEFGMFGRVTSWKGQAIAIEAFALALADGLPEDARLRIVGGALFDEDAAYAAALREQVAALGMQDRVVFRGHVADVAAELSACHVVVHASLRPEPFGQVVVEAMAAGRAVIAADAGGPAEVVDHDRTGLLASPGDPRALADMMLRTADPDTRSRLGTAARAEAERYRPERIAEELEREYLSVLAR